MSSASQSEAGRRMSTAMEALGADTLYLVHVLAAHRAGTPEAYEKQKSAGAWPDGRRDVWAQVDVAANVQTRTDDAAIDLLAGKSFAEAEAALGPRTKAPKL